MDGAIAYSSAARIIQAVANLLTIFFIATLLSSDEQGYYYTFASVVGIQVFFELGFTGIMTQRQQIEKEQLLYDLYSVPFVKPMNVDLLKQIVMSHSGGLITIEEHQKSRGMGSAVVEMVNDLYATEQIPAYPIIKRIAIPDEFADVVGTQQYLREYEKLNL